MRKSSGDWLEVGISVYGCGWLDSLSTALVYGWDTDFTFGSLLLGKEQIPLLRAWARHALIFVIAACCVNMEAATASFLAWVKRLPCYHVQEGPLLNISNNEILHCISERFQIGCILSCGYELLLNGRQNYSFLKNSSCVNNRSSLVTVGKTLLLTDVTNDSVFPLNQRFWVLSSRNDYDISLKKYIYE